MKTKRLFSVLILTILLPLVAAADTWQDPETKVNYEYSVGQSKASVKAGTSSMAGSPETVGDIAILSSFTVNGNTYSVTSIGYHAFSRCSGLTSVTIQESVTTIDVSAFSHCSGLTSVTIPSSVTDISNYAFRDCTSLTSVTIPEGVTKIGSWTFWGCIGLTSVTIPSSMTRIGNGAFSGCTSLTSVTSLIQEPFGIDESVFQYWDTVLNSNKFTSATLYVPKGTKEKYETTAAWNQFQNIVEIENSGVEAVSHQGGAATVTGRYTLGGRRSGAGQRGLNIVRMSDGTSRKVVE